MATLIRAASIPVGIIEGFVGDRDRFLVTVRTEKFGLIDMFMASTDPVIEGDEIYIVPLAGGAIVGMSKSLGGLGDDFLERESCSERLL